MKPDIRWLTAVFWDPRAKGDQLTHIGLFGSARPSLIKMAAQLVGTDGLVALYLPEGTDDNYQPGKRRGRVIGAVKLCEMPEVRRVEDYFYNDPVDGTRRWPIGWPCRQVYAPDIEKCPVLREYVEAEDWGFKSYLSRLHQKGPIELEPKIRDRLNRDFATFNRIEI